MSHHQCDYGCLAGENREEKCVHCGHPRRFHSPAHPHVCMGTLGPDGVSFTRSCVCAGFTLTPVYVPVEVNPEAIDSEFKPLEGLGN